MYYWFGYMNEMNSQLNMNIDNKNLQFIDNCRYIKYCYDYKSSHMMEKISLNDIANETSKLHI